MVEIEQRSMLRENTGQIAAQRAWAQCCHHVAASSPGTSTPQTGRIPHLGRHYLLFPKVTAIQGLGYGYPEPENILRKEVTL